MTKIFLLLGLLSSPAVAQTTNCQWIGNVWSCNTPQARPGIDWSIMRPSPNYNNGIMEAFRQGEMLRQQQERDRTPDRPSSNGVMSAAECKGRLEASLAARDFELAKALAAICN